MSGTSAKLLRICWLFPGSLHLYGERGNILALQHEAAQLGWRSEVTRVEMSDIDSFDPKNFDIIVSPPGELDALKPAVHLLSPELESLRDWIDEGGVLFSTGTNMALWGHGIDRLDGDWQPGLGLIDISCQEREFVTGDDLWVQYRTADSLVHNAIGHQIQRLNIYLGPEAEVWGQDIVYGYGLNGVGYTGPEPGGPKAVGNSAAQGHYHVDAKQSGRSSSGTPQGAGVRLGNSLFTVMLGPALFVNRRLLADLLKPISEPKGWDWEPERLDWREYEAMLAAKKNYIQKKIQTEE